MKTLQKEFILQIIVATNLMHSSFPHPMFPHFMVQILLKSLEQIRILGTWIFLEEEKEDLWSLNST
jgi:hypothetical protein